MSRCIIIAIAILGVSLPYASAADHPNSTGTPDANPSLGRTTHPIVVRLNQEALRQIVRRDIDHKGDVNKVVLGTTVIGDSHTTGAVFPQPLMDEGRASFLVTFSGNTNTRSVGYSGPAIIYSSTATDFVCTRPVSFEPRTGFVAGSTSVKANTTLKYDGFDATRRGPGKFLVRRVASRRAQQSHEEARATAHRDNVKEITEQFDKSLNEGLAMLNQRMNMARLVQAVLGKDDALQLLATSDENSIYLAITGAGTPIDPKALPKQSLGDSPVEFWVHTNMFLPMSGEALKIPMRIDNQALIAAGKVALLGALVMAEDVTDKTLDVAAVGEWLVVGLKAEAFSTVSTSLPTSSAPRAK